MFDYFKNLWNTFVSSNNVVKEEPFTPTPIKKNKKVIKPKKKTKKLKSKRLMKN